MKRLDSIEEFESIINGSKVIVIFYNYFHASMFVKDTYIKQLIDKHSDVDFLGVNVDDYPEIVDKYDIKLIPCIIRCENGYMVNNISVFASVEELEEFIK